MGLGRVQSKCLVLDGSAARYWLCTDITIVVRIQSSDSLPSLCETRYSS